VSGARPSRSARTRGGSVRPAIASAGFGAGLTLVAVLFDAEPLYVPGLTFLLLTAACAVWILRGARDIGVTRTLSATRVVEDEPLHVVVRVDAGRAGLPTGEVVDPLLPEPAALAMGRRSTRVRITARFARRGRRTLAAPVVRVRDPFGLVTRTIPAGPEAEVLVLPAIHPVTVAGGGADDGGLGLGRRARPHSAEIELEGIGPLREGTPASRIHWPSIARRAEPQERRLEAEGERTPLVILDPVVGDGPDALADLDAAVRATASLVLHLAGAGGCQVLLPGDRRPVPLDATLGGWPRIHARLALVGPTERPSVSGVAGRVGPVVYVSARALRRAPRALAHAPAGGRVLVIPGRLPGGRELFTVAGCHGYETSGAARPLRADRPLAGTAEGTG
jgi:uncharacterized protein (DUF58 family)